MASTATLQVYASTQLWRQQVRAFLLDFGFVNIGQFGAKGDGVTDDTAAFTRALTDGRPIALDASKTYAVNQVQITNATTCPAIFSLGGRARVVNSVVDPTSGWLFYISKSNGFLFQNISFEMPVSTDPVTAPGYNRALYFEPTGGTSDGCSVDNCRFVGARFGVAMTGIARNAWITRSYFTGSWSEGITVQAPQNFNIVSNILEDGGYATGSPQPSGAIRTGYSAQTDLSYNVNIIANEIRRYCVPASQSAVDCFSGSARGIRITDNICDSCGAGIELKTAPWTGGTDDTYDGNVVDDNTIIMRDADGGAVTFFHAAAGAPATKAARQSISGNTIFCKTVPSAGAPTGISILGHRSVVANGNKMWNIAQGFILGGTGPTGNTAYDYVLSSNSIDATQNAIVCNGGTINGLYIRDNPLLRSAGVGKPAVGLFSSTIINADVGGNRIEAPSGWAIEIRDVQGAEFHDNELVGIYSVVSQGTAPINIKIRDNDLIATTGPACNLAVGSAMTIQNNDVDVPVGARTVSGAGTYISAHNSRGTAAANPTGTAAGAIGDYFDNSAPAPGGWSAWICTTAGGAGVAVYKGVSAVEV